MEIYHWKRVYEKNASNLDQFFDYLLNLPLHIVREQMSEKLAISTDACQRYIFRGQADANWKLIPSAFRKENFELLKYLLGGYTGPINTSKRVLLNNAINEFCRQSDENGLDIPGLSNLEKDRIVRNANRADSIKVGSVLSHRIALAQHYQLPTGLLDWSEKPLIACYFAASNALEILINDKTIEKPSKISVWALNIDPHNYLVSEYHQDANTTPFQIHNVPRHGNENLVAQKGVFTFWDKMIIKEQNEILEMESEELDKYITHMMPMLVKITLGIEHIAQLMIRLRDKDIYAATMFPGYNGIAKSVMEDAKTKKLFFLKKKEELNKE